MSNPMINLIERAITDPPVLRPMTYELATQNASAIVVRYALRNQDTVQSSSSPSEPWAAPVPSPLPNHIHTLAGTEKGHHESRKSGRQGNFCVENWATVKILELNVRGNLSSVAHSHSYNSGFPPPQCRELFRVRVRQTVAANLFESLYSVH